MSEDDKNRGAQAPEGAREWLSLYSQPSFRTVSRYSSIPSTGLLPRFL
jgi:hypothetical protein